MPEHVPCASLAAQTRKLLCTHVLPSNLATGESQRHARRASLRVNSRAFATLSLARWLHRSPACVILLTLSTATGIV